MLVVRVPRKRRDLLKCLYKAGVLVRKRRGLSLCKTSDKREKSTKHSVKEIPQLVVEMQESSGVVRMSA